LENGVSLEELVTIDTLSAYAIISLFILVLLKNFVIHISGNANFQTNSRSFNRIKTTDLGLEQRTQKKGLNSQISVDEIILVIKSAALLGLQVGDRVYGCARESRKGKKGR